MGEGCPARDRKGANTIQGIFDHGLYPGAELRRILSIKRFPPQSVKQSMRLFEEYLIVED